MTLFFFSNHRISRLLIASFGLLPLVPLNATLPAPDGGAPMMVVDVHTHLFNAHDLPLSGIFNTHDVPAFTCDALAKVINAWTSKDDLNGPLPDKEPRPESAGVLRAQTLAKISGGAPMAPGAAGSLFKAAGLSKEEEDAITDLLRDDIAAVPKAAPAVAAPGVPPQPPQPQEVLVVARALQKLDFPPGESHVPEAATGGAPLAPGAPGPLAGIGGAVSFLGVMMKGNLHIARQLETTEFPKVDLFVHHMMDLEKAYNTPPKVLFHEQITRMARLDADPHLGGKFVHFVAFDPFRGRGLALDSVKSGLNAGALGIKFYPPSGYRAATNAEPGAIPPRPSWKRRSQERWDSRYKGRSGAELDAITEELFAYAEKEGKPVFSHCTPHGFEAGESYGLMGDPKYWRKVLEKHPNLRLCLAHAGGDGYWFPPAKTTPDDLKSADFGTEVVKLCKEYANAYCEAGYLEQILKPAERGKFKTRLSEVINEPTKHGRKFGDKIMYGTDWHMIQKEPRHEEYLDDFAEVFQAETLRPWARKFFARNAIEFIQLRKAAQEPVYTEAQRKAWQQLISAAYAE